MRFEEMKRLSVLLLLPFVATVFAQDKSVRDFVIDQSKPYVYLKFDHIGPRKSIQNGEDGIGLWLKVVNNCRVPIVLQSFNMPEGVPGIGLMDEVLPTEPILQISSTPIPRQEQHHKSKKMPEGYSSETAGVARVQPGTDVLFSVPLNHVDDDWYMRVKFALDLDKSSVSVGPFTYLSFYKWDIPKELRPPKTTTQ